MTARGDEGNIGDLVRILGSASISVERDYPIGLRTTYRVGGSASVFVEVADLAELQLVATAVAEHPVPTFVLGKGSNTLVHDRGFGGLCIGLGDGFAEIEIDGRSVTAGAATSLPVLARTTVGAGLGGLEWAVGVPGSVGGAVRMNAGGHGSDLSNSLAAVRVVDLLTGNTTYVSAADLALDYRHSNVAASTVVVEAEFQLVPGDVDTGKATLSDIVQWRRAHQPGGQNAGSVFTNPDGDSAGRLIDASGLRGTRHGSAHVSEKHANFIQADPDGAASDVFALMVVMRETVLHDAGVELHPETRLLGFTSAELQSVGREGL